MFVFGVYQRLVTLTLPWLPRRKTSPYSALSVTLTMLLPPYKERLIFNIFITLYSHF